MIRTVIAQQGEAKVFRVTALPPSIALAPMRDRNAANLPIISHSERGHHHVLDRADIEVLERTTDVPKGMRILYAIVTEPTSLKQDAHVPHQPVSLDPGIYEFRIQREYDPLMEQARQVAD